MSAHMMLRPVVRSHSNVLRMKVGYCRSKIAFRGIEAQMSDGYKELIKGNPDETEIRSFLVNGNQVSVTLRIPDTLRDAAKEEASLRGMSFSAFVRTCMIEELAKKGQ